MTSLGDLVNRLQHIVENKDNRPRLEKWRSFQTVYMAAMGDTRNTFCVKTGLAILMAPIAFLYGYMFDAETAFNTLMARPDLHPLTIAIATLFHLAWWMSRLLVPLLFVHLVWSTLTGMFQKSFWDDVRIERETMASKNTPVTSPSP